MWVSNAGFLPDLNAVISGFGFQSCRLVGVSLVHPTRSECIHFGFASAVFECNDGSLVVLPEIHEAVFRGLDACCMGCAVKFAGVDRRTYTERGGIQQHSQNPGLSSKTSVA